MSRIISSGRGSAVSWPQVYLGVGFTTLATLVLELALTRIYSVVFYYHFAFLAISVALFGLGVGGVCSYLLASHGRELFRRLGTLAAANSVAVVGALWFLLTRGAEIGNAALALIYLTSALPFVFAGAVVSLAISETIERVDRVYFFDLLGAAAGCLLLVPLLNLIGGANTVLAAAALYGISSAIWFNLAASMRGRVAAVALALAVAALVVFNARRPILDVRYAKGQRLIGERFVRWNSFSRIALAPEAGSGPLTIYIDADASTGIPHFDFNRLSPADRNDLLYQGPGLPYALRPGAKTLIIGPGGGWDVARALASGSRDITGVEINPIIADTIMRRRFPFLSRRLYLRPEVHIQVEDGRSFVRRSAERYQVLQLTLVDTWAATAAGAFALSENNLYTVEAFEEYLRHLTPDGLLAFTRWGFDPPRESLRLVTIAVEALQRLEKSEPWRHVLVVREGAEQIRSWGARDTVLISREPFSTADLDSARHILAQTGIQAVYLPGDRGGSAFAGVLRSADPSRFLDQYPYDVSAVDDNRPFFFYTVQPRDLWTFLTSASTASADYKINRAVPLLFGVVGVSLAATAFMLTLPPLVLGSRLPRERGVRGFLWYFVFLGAGYILIQVALIQKFVLFLGHPTYALTVVIFSMLVSSGLGSFASRRLGMFADARLRWALGSIFVLVALLAALVPPLAEAGVGWPLWLRITATVALLFPAGFAMGMPFPAGLARLESRHKPAVRWAWSLNAASSVLGSGGAIFLALYLGLQETLLIGGLMYLGALVVVRKSWRMPVEEPGLSP